MKKKPNATNYIDYNSFLPGGSSIIAGVEICRHAKMMDNSFIIRRINILE